MHGNDSARARPQSGVDRLTSACSSVQCSELAHAGENPAAADLDSFEDRPPWLFEGENMMACRCDFCLTVGPWAEGLDAAEAAALAAGWLGEKDDELDTEGALVCRTVTWVCPGCKA